MIASLATKSGWLSTTMWMLWPLGLLAISFLVEIAIYAHSVGLDADLDVHRRSGLHGAALRKY